TSTTGAGGDAGSDVDNGMPSTNYPAPHAPPPRVQWSGGPVLASPEIYPIFFSNDTDTTMMSQIEDFVSKVGQTTYWTAIGTEYGVGAATGHPAVHLQETATGTIGDSDIQSWLADKLNSDDPNFPTADDNTIIALYYPAGVNIEQGGSLSCSSFG